MLTPKICNDHTVCPVPHTYHPRCLTCDSVKQKDIDLKASTSPTPSNQDVELKLLRELAKATQFYFDTGTDYDKVCDAIIAYKVFNIHVHAPSCDQGLCEIEEN